MTLELQVARLSEEIVKLKKRVTSLECALAEMALIVDNLVETEDLAADLSK